MSSVIGVITARMGSNRLPGKVMKPVTGKSIFEHHVERMSEVKGLNGVFLATSTDPKNNILIDEAERLGCGYYAGPEEDIVERHIKLCEQEGADAVIRVTCDCPLFNIDITTKFVDEFKKEYHDFIFCGNMTMIQGTLSELISYNALKRVHESYRGPAVSLPIREKMATYKTKSIDVEPDFIRPEYRLTVDEMPDYALMEHIYNSLYEGKAIPLKDVYRWLDDNPEIASINKNVCIKGVNQYAANLMEKPLYSIIKSGEGYVIVDDHKRHVYPEVFLNEIASLIKSGNIK